MHAIILEQMFLVKQGYCLEIQYEVNDHQQEICRKMGELPLHFKMLQFKIILSGKRKKFLVYAKLGPRYRGN